MDTHDYKTIQQIKRHRAAKLARILAGAYMRWRKKQDDEMKEFLCIEFMKLGGVYVKFLQGVLLRSEFMRRWHNPEKLRVFEQLETEPIDIEALLKKELTAAHRKQIVNLNPVPFAAGSFGQVYYGMHQDGTPIVIKALRPMIRETLKFDLRLLGIFMKRFSKRLYPNSSVDIKKPLEDFKIATLRETDYVSEAEFAAEMHEAYKNNPLLVIPKTYLDLCTPNIIVQEYIDGISAAHLVKMKEQGVDVRRYVSHYLGSDLHKQIETLGFEFIVSIFSLPRIQGDPHPGNIKFLTGNRVGMIDFGIIAHAPAEKPAVFGLMTEYHKLYNSQLDVASLFGQIVRFLSPDLYLALDKVNQILPPDQQSDNLAKDVGRVAAEGFEKTTAGVDIESMIADGSLLSAGYKLINKDNKFGLRMKLDSSDMIRAIMTFWPLPDMLASTKVTARVLERALPYIKQNFAEDLIDEENDMSVNRAVEVIGAWLERVADKDPQLFSVLSAKMQSQPKAAKEIEETIKKEIE